MKERLHLVERAQLSFAAAASHELRTPLHQLNAAAAMLRQTLGGALVTPNVTPPLEDPGEMSSKKSFSSVSGQSTSSQSEMLEPDNFRFLQPELDAETRKEAISQLEIIESNGSSLGSILDNIIDTLDIGRSAANRHEDKAISGSALATRPTENRATNFSAVLEEVLHDALRTEVKARRVAGVKNLDDVEVILEIIPRARGGWLMTDDSGPLSR